MTIGARRLRRRRRRPRPVADRLGDRRGPGRRGRRRRVPHRRDHAAGADPADRAPAGRLSRACSSPGVGARSVRDIAVRRPDRLDACVERRSSAPSGPATSTPEQIRALVDAGMDVARLNLSHGDHEDHEQVYRDGARGRRRDRPRRSASSSTCRAPRSGSARFADGPVDARARAQEFTITTRDVPGDADDRSHDVQGPARRRRAPATRSSSTTAGSRLEVTRRRRHRRARPRVEVGRPVSNNKGINLPGVAVIVPALTREGQARTCAGRCS